MGWAIKGERYHCGNCNQSWLLADEVLCACSTKSSDSFSPAQEIDKPDTGTAEGLLRLDGRGLQLLLAESLIELKADKKTSAARKAEIFSKVVNTLAKLQAEDRDDLRIAKLEQAVSQLEDR